MLRPLLATVFALGLPLGAQTPPPEAQTLSTLLTEVRQLRQAIERSTLLGARTQLAVLMLQTQETRTARMAEDLEKIRRELAQSETTRSGLAEQVKRMESAAGDLSTPPPDRANLEREAKMIKPQLETMLLQGGLLRAREAEATSQLQMERERLTQLQNQISDMEQALDNAIRQMAAPQL